MGTAVFGAPEWKARNGLYVRQCENGGVEVGAEMQVKDYTPPAATFALEEFFQAKRDAELGRWRWPENPDYVVYPRGEDRVRVILESTGDFADSSRGTVIVSPFKDAARAYFDAHPESKPWHDAEQGEFWAVHHMGMVEVCQVRDGRFEGVDMTHGSRVSMPVTHHSITEAHRLVVESAS